MFGNRDHKLDDTRTRVMVQMDYEPEGIKESIGSVVGADDRRVKKDLESFKEMIETSGHETAAGAATSNTDREAASLRCAEALPIRSAVPLGGGGRGGSKRSQSPRPTVSLEIGVQAALRRPLDAASLISTIAEGAARFR